MVDLVSVFRFAGCSLCSAHSAPLHNSPTYRVYASGFTVVGLTAFVTAAGVLPILWAPERGPGKSMTFGFILVIGMSTCPAPAHMHTQGYAFGTLIARKSCFQLLWRSTGILNAFWKIYEFVTALTGSLLAKAEMMVLDVRDG